MAVIFSIPAFFIVLREVLEACLVVGIVLAYLNKIGATNLRKWVWVGAGAGIALALAVGIAFGIVFYVTDDQLFEGDAEKIFEGVTFLVAAALLTWMIIWMMVLGKDIQRHMEQKVDQIVDSDNSSSKTKWGIFLMVFFQVLREGIETVIFLIGTTNAEEQGGWGAIPLPGVLALIVGLVISYSVFQGLVNVDIVQFLYISSFVLIAFAAGLVSHAFHELQEVDLFGEWKPAEGRDWYNAVMWSTKDCCNDKENQFFAMLRALFGYQDTPTFVEWATYFGYWLIIIAIFVVINWASIRAARSKLASKTRLISSLSLLFTFVGWIFTLLNVTWIGVLTMSLSFLLSIVAVFVVFDFSATRITALRLKRRVIVMGTGISFALLMAFMFVLHIVEMECEGTGGECGLEMFFFFGLIFNPSFNASGRTESDWHALASLSASIVLTVYFFGGLAFCLILFALNLDTEGNYIHDDAIMAKQVSEEEGNSSDHLLPGQEEIAAGH